MMLDARGEVSRDAPKSATLNVSKVLAGACFSSDGGVWEWAAHILAEVVYCYTSAIVQPKTVQAIFF
jgi:hypothetical protein